ncbi:SRPBCC family protein [Nocardioides aquiterrae]|uniref:Carbon monoxide dehydrogenase n=1 Tax=Nocardioides aquiterrae TaxID=203799 RepID=A0ABN1UH48_9ACTN
MLLSNDFEVAQPVDKVWAFFGDVPQVAACLPGAELTEDLGDDTYGGGVAVRMGPVKLEFDGKARIVERDDQAKRLVLDASGADRKGRGQASMTVTAVLTAAGRGTRVHLEQDLQLSGAAAQYGRGMISDVTTVLMGQFAANAQQRIDALERGEAVAATAKPASGLAIGLQAARMALMRVFRRFFLSYRPELRSR